MGILEITIERKTNEGSPVVAERTSRGSVLRRRAEGLLQLGPEQERALLAAEIDPQAYGTILGEALFRDTVRDAFGKARAEANDVDRLRLLLTIEDPELRTLRWERLCAPFDAGWDFLALNQEAPYSLYLPSLADRRFSQIGRLSLRALIVAANPAGLNTYRLEPFNVAAAVTGVQSALGDIPSDVLVTDQGGSQIAGSIGPATLDAIAEEITGGTYTLLHLVGHGSVPSARGEQGETILYLAKPDGTVDPVSGTRFLDRLKRLNPRQGFPRFAFLAACESASATAEVAGGLGGLAQRLVRELGMPAVVAMTDKVTVATATTLGSLFYQRLREHGHPDLALVEATAGLAERGDITVPALYSRLAGTSLFSDDVRPLQELTPAEIANGLNRVAPLLEERAPVLLSDSDNPEDSRRGFQPLAKQLRGLGSADPAQLPEPMQKERKAALEEIDAIATEVLALPFAALALGKDPPAYDPRNPFRGLNPFRAEDRAFFFGREELIKELLDRLAKHPFVPVLGPSGSGKSSVVLAGLVPKLVGAPPEASESGESAELALKRDMRPGADPQARLDELLTRLADSPGVIVVDQFEEVFTLCRDEEKRVAFFDRILALTAERPVVLTMRADFWGECAPYATLRSEMEKHQRLIAPMDAAELRSAIERQAGAVGLRFEADLAATILDQVQGEPGAMPLLQHALRELWQRRHGRWLLASEYRTIGGVQGAIAKTAETVYAELTEPEQERVRDIFVRLTRLDEEAASGVERRDTRRRVALEELVPADGDVGATKALVARLASAGLVVTSRTAPLATSGMGDVLPRQEHPPEGRDEVEVAHEALIRRWPRLREWLEEDRSDLLLRESIREAALEWQRHELEESYLTHRGKRLQAAEALASHPTITLNPLEQAYLDASVALRKGEEQEREAQRQQELAAERLAFLQAQAARAQDLADKAQIQREAGEHERGALLARQAYLFSEAAEGQVLVATDAALRGALGVPYFGRALRGHGRRVFSLAFSPDGRMLAAGSRDQTIRLWDLTQPAAVPAEFVGHQDRVTSVSFSPSGQTLVSGSWDRTVRLWDLTQPAAPLTF